MMCPYCTHSLLESDNTFVTNKYYCDPCDTSFIIIEHDSFNFKKFIEDEVTNEDLFTALLICPKCNTLISLEGEIECASDAGDCPNCGNLAGSSSYGYLHDGNYPTDEFRPEVCFDFGSYEKTPPIESPLKMEIIEKEESK